MGRITPLYVHALPQDDLICLPAKLSSSLGGLGPLVLCSKVSNQISLIDPQTLR
jgi:nonsense-mediated mRNA decay protein 3